jgi:hypothetical protein
METKQRQRFKMRHEIGELLKLFGLAPKAEKEDKRVRPEQQKPVLPRSKAQFATAETKREMSIQRRNKRKAAKRGNKGNQFN